LSPRLGSLNPAAQHFRDAPGLGVAAARCERRFGVEDFADRTDASLVQVRDEAFQAAACARSVVGVGAMTPVEQKIGFELVGKLNALHAVEYPQDPALAARIRSYELAYRMQRSLPEVLDFSHESKETKALYGIDRPETQAFGSQMLACRRMVERGVRFIQVQHGAGGAGVWDQHGGLNTGHARNCLGVDKPIAGLLKDLKRTGLLESTLVVFATEFGRTPGTQGADGRDHHIFGFSVWLAGGGIKGGVVHGATDEIGFHAVEHPHYVTDVHATILHLLGLDSRKLEVPSRKRLEIDHGKPIREIMA
jgi:Protein of unknown function (DUF1501)